LPAQSSLPVTAPLSAPSKKKTNVQATSQAASLTFFTTKVAHLNAGIHSSSTKALFVPATVPPVSRCFFFGKPSHCFFEDFCSYAVPFVAVSQAALSFAFATPSAPHSAFFRASDSCCGAITLGTTSHADACSIVTISSKILALYEKSIAKFSASFDDTPLPPEMFAMTSRVILPALALSAAPPAASTSAAAPSFCTASESLAAALHFAFLAVSALLPQAPASHPVTLRIVGCSTSLSIPSPSLFAEQLFCSSLSTSSASPSIAGCFRMKSRFFATCSITKVVNDDNSDKRKPRVAPTSGSPALSETRITAIGIVRALSAVSPNAPLMQQFCSWSVPAKIHFEHLDPKSSNVWFVHPYPWVVHTTLIRSILSVVCFKKKTNDQAAIQAVSHAAYVWPILLVWFSHSSNFALLLSILISVLHLVYLYLKVWFPLCSVRFVLIFFQWMQMKQIRLGILSSKAIFALLLSMLPSMAAGVGVMFESIDCNCML
jgi:hypothetical protein